MNPLIATIACAVVIATLFMLNRDRGTPTSIALWIPVVWLLIAGSRNVSEWLQWGGTIDAADRYLEGNPVDRNVLTILMACGVIVLLGRKQRIASILRANTPLLVYFFYCGISIFWSDYTLVAGKRWFRGLGDVIMLLVIFTDPSWRIALKRVLTRVGVLLLPISVLLIKYFPYWGRAYGQDGTAYWTGVAAGKNSLGMISLIFGLSAVWCFLGAYRSRENRFRTRHLVAHGTVVVIALWLLWVANSKTSLVCFVLACSLMIVTTFSTFARKPAVLFSMVITLVSIAFAVLFLGVGGGALEAMGRNSSLTGRTDIWKVVIKFADNPWVGSGYESFWLGKRLEQIADALNVKLLNQAHNGYIEIYLNLGWIGVVLLAVLIVTGYRTIISRFHED
jgi:O-antigen ligase